MLILGISLRYEVEHSVTLLNRFQRHTVVTARVENSSSITYTHNVLVSFILEYNYLSYLGARPVYHAP